MVFLGGVCWMLIAFIEDIEEDWIGLNKIEENPLEFKKKLYNIIQFHTSAIQLSGNLNLFRLSLNHSFSLLQICKRFFKYL